MKKFNSFLLYEIISPLLAALAVFLVAGLRFKEPVWQLDDSVLLVAISTAGAFLAGFVILQFPVARTRKILLILLRSIAVGALVSLPVALYFLLKDIDISRLVILLSFGLLFLLLIINSYRNARKYVLVINVLVVAGILGYSSQGLNLSQSSDNTVAFNSLVSYEFANYHDIRISKYKIFDHSELANGGSIDVIDGSHLLLATGYGQLYVVDTSGDSFVADRLDAKIPIDGKRYQSESPSPNEFFRVTDILLAGADSTTNNSTRKLYTAHHHYDKDNQCYTLRVSETWFDPNSFQIGDWVARYDTHPCIKINEFPNLTGGRLGLLPDGKLLLTVGAHSYKTREFIELEGSHYGRVMQIDPVDWTASVFSRGHRNPQGLHIGTSKIWSTEHGPEGGDELNVLEAGADYGWPESTFGSDYGKKTYEGNMPGQYLYGRLPLYSWVPSIGVSNLLEIRGDEFPAWKGDLMVASLNGTSLFRVRFRDGRAVTIERLQMGERIRDIIEMPDGKIVLWNGQDTLLYLESASFVFSECQGCHSLSMAGHSIGPDLRRIVDRKVAGRDGYVYSDAMKAFGGKWTVERLDAFMANPDKVIPGTKMQFPGIADAAKRKEIIQFLQGHQDYNPDDRR